MDEKPPKSKTDPVIAPSRLTPEAKFNPAFDSWLETKLHGIFDAVASEPLPDDLMKLLDQINQAEKGAKK